jgi:type I restriction enzyme M protein
MSAFPLRRFDEVCTLEYGASLPKEKRVEGPYPVVGSNGITGYHNEYLVEGPAIVVGRKGSAGEVTLIEENCFPIDTTYYVKQTNPAESNARFLFWLLKTLNLPELRGGAGIPGLNRSDVYETHQIPLPPLDVQKEIVAEIERYQKVINGARAVLDHYRPHIHIHPDWPREVFGDVTSTITPPAKIQAGDFRDVGRYPIIDQSQNAIAGRTDDESTLIDGSGGYVIFGDHTCAVKFIDERFAQGADGIKIIKAGDRLEPKFAYFYLLSHPIEQDGYKRHFGKLKESSIAIPPVAIQQAIVAEIEAEQALVAANRELITRFEKKIQATLARIWGEAALIDPDS